MAHSDVPTFIGYAKPGGEWRPDFPAQVQAWCKRLAGDVGAELEIRIVEAGHEKTGKQVRGFHAMVSPWAKERGWRLEDLKQFLLSKIFGWLEFVDPQTGEVIKVLAEPHTGKLTKAQYSELIEQTMVLAADDDFMLVAPDEYRKAKELAARQAANRAKREARRAA